MSMQVEDIQSSPLKRAAPEDGLEEERLLNLKGTQFIIPTPPATSDESPSHSMSSFKRELSPAGSVSTLSSIQDVSSVGDTPRASAPLGSAPPAKRRKLTPSEKIEQQRQKEIKAQEKLELQAKKAAEKAKKEEEKQIRDRELQEKKAEREIKKQEKDHEQAIKQAAKLKKQQEKEQEENQKQEAKLKKERSQMRIGSFFQRPAEAGDASPVKIPARRRSMSLETYDKMQVHVAEVKASQEVAPTPVVSDYRKHFLPWQPKPHTTLPALPLVAGPEYDAAQARYDEELRAQSAGEAYDLGLSTSYISIQEQFKADRPRGRTTIRVRDCLDQLQGSQYRPVDLTGTTDPLQSISMRYLHFREDVRPPYSGTCTSVTSPRAIKKLRRNPFARTRENVNYDEDSEAEWEQEDGEDVDEDDEDEESIGDDDEMDDLIDDEDDVTQRRRVVAPIVAECSGVCWQDSAGKLHGDKVEMLRGLHMQMLLPNHSRGPIDPFSTAYWDLPSVKAPLKERSTNIVDAKPDNGWPIASKTPGPKKGSKGGTQKSMNATEMDAFKTAVVGSMLGKAELVNKLKEQFPNLTSAFVKDTLGEKFAQLGKSKSKKWVFVNTN